MNKRKQYKDKYWLFWSPRGYFEWKSFDTLKDAKASINDNMKKYEYPVLIKGKFIAL